MIRKKTLAEIISEIVKENVPIIGEMSLRLAWTLEGPAVL